MLEILTLVFKIIAFGGVASFVLPFLGVGWWRSAMGRHVMAFMSMIFVLVVLAIVSDVWPNYPGRPIVRTLCWAWIAGMLWWRALLRRRAQHDTLDQERSDQGSENR